jgi:hypothetical protein
MQGKDMNTKDPGTTLTAEAAVAIFVARDSHSSKDALSCKLAGDYGITSKSVRDIWNMRTWGWATFPHWTEADKRRYLESRLCIDCRRRGVQSVDSACDRCTVRCTVTKRRGRPPGIKETKPRRRASAMGEEASKGAAANGASFGAQGFPANFQNAMFPGQMQPPQMLLFPQHPFPNNLQQQQMFSQTLQNLQGSFDADSPQAQQQQLNFQQQIQLQQQYMQQLMHQQHMQQAGQVPPPGGDPAQGQAPLDGQGGAATVTAVTATGSPQGAAQAQAQAQAPQAQVTGVGAVACATAAQASQAQAQAIAGGAAAVASETCSDVAQAAPLAPSVAPALPEVPVSGTGVPPPEPVAG